MGFGGAAGWCGAGCLLDPAEGSRVELVAPAVDAGRRSVSFDAESAATGLLDDPGTVFPVIIDPSAITQTYAVRVTQEFNKYNSDIGSRGKIGYNGWTAPYYKSRLYYQFRWPTNDDGSSLRPEQITEAEFTDVQTHSPQHDCSNHSFGPSVKVQLHNSIDGDTTWGNQPGTHDVGSKNDDYAVGHEDVCHDTHTQTWNITTMTTNERREYPTRASITVGIRSSDETDRNGWREYKHDPGDSPRFKLTYEAEPPAPESAWVNDPDATSPTTVANTSDVTLMAMLKLAGEFKCRGTTACLQADYTVIRHLPGNQNVTALAGRKSAAADYQGTPVTVSTEVTGLAEGSYTASIRTYNSYTGLYSAVATTLAFTVDRAPAKPTWSWVADGWSGQAALPAGTRLSVSIPTSSLDADVAQVCVSWIAGDQSGTECAEPVAPATILPVGPESGFAPGSISAQVTASDPYSSSDPQLDSPASRALSW